MTVRLPPLNPLRVFEAAARHASFTRAAHELSITQGAVSKQVKVLEEHLGVPLFDRGPRGLDLNRKGRRYAASVGEAFRLIARATEETGAAHPHAVLAIRGYTAFLALWLVPQLADFTMREPGIEVRLVSSSDPVDFRRESVDVAIRYGRGRWPGLAGTFLFADALVPVCNPKALAEAHGAGPGRIFARHPLLHLNSRAGDWPEWLDAARVPPPDGSRDLYFEDLSVLLECARAGFGIALGQSAYLERDIASGTLLIAHPFVLHRSLGYWLVYPREREDDHTIRRFRDWISSRCAAAESAAPPAQKPGWSGRRDSNSRP